MKISVWTYIFCFKNVCICELCPLNKPKNNDRSRSQSLLLSRMWSLDSLEKRLTSDLRHEMYQMSLAYFTVPTNKNVVKDKIRRTPMRMDWNTIKTVVIIYSNETHDTSKNLFGNLWKVLENQLLILKTCK